MFATRLPRHNGETYLDGFAHTEWQAKLYFDKPTERVRVSDVAPGEASEYWAWWDAKNVRFDFVFISRARVEMCFPYGSASETNKGNGEIVNVKVEPFVKDDVP